MTKVTSQEIAQFRSQLADDKSDMEALDLIEDCDGDLEDAAMTLAIRAGQEPERANSEWLDALARKWRAVICEHEYREDLLNGSLSKDDGTSKNNADVSEDFGNTSFDLCPQARREQFL